MRKNIKNYTTSMPIDRIVDMIEKLVVSKMKAKQFFKEYKDGKLIGVVFVILTDKGELPFKMPARIEKIEQLFLSQKKAKYSWEKPELSQNEIDQAKRTAWKNIYDWIDAQIALIETEQVRIEEVMLPYLTTQSGVTLFEIMEKNKFALPSGKEQ